MVNRFAWFAAVAATVASAGAGLLYAQTGGTVDWRDKRPPIGDVVGTTGTRIPDNLVKWNSQGQAVDAGISAIGGGSGDVVGPAGAINNNLATFNGATGKLLKDSGLAIGSLVPTSRTIAAGTGLTGGGDLSADRTFSLAAGAAVANLGFTPPPNTRSVTGTGLLTGGGDLTADRTLSVAAIATNSLLMNPTGAPAVPSAVSVPPCADAGGNHLNYSGGAFSCGTSSSGGGSISATDGTTTVNPASTLSFGTGFDVVDGGGGNAQIGLTSVLSDKTGADYTVVTGDASKTILVGAHTYTLPQAGSAGFAAGWSGCFVNTSAGDATISTTTSTFKGAGGASTLTLQPNTWACPASDGTNWNTVYAPSTFGIGANAPLFGSGGGGAVGGTRSGNTTKVVTMDASSPATNDCAKFDANDNLTTSGAPCGGSGSPGGSSGDIQYNNAGAFGGRAPSGNGTSVVTTTGTQTSGRCVEIDANGNHVAAAAGCGAAGTSAAIIAGTTGGGTLTNTIVYFGTNSNTTAPNARPIVVPADGTVSGLTCISSSAPGAGITWTFTLNVNGSDNTNQQVAGTNVSVYTTGTDTPVSVTRGDYITFHLTFSSGTPAGTAGCSLKYVI